MIFMKNEKHFFNNNNNWVNEIFMKNRKLKKT